MKSAHQLDFDTAAAYLLYRLRLPMRSAPYSIATTKGIISKRPLQEPDRSTYWNDIETQLGDYKDRIIDRVKQKAHYGLLTLFDYTYHELTNLGVQLSLIATASRHLTVKLWDAVTGDYIRCLKEGGEASTHNFAVL